jgi:hypothetical protein
MIFEEPTLFVDHIDEPLLDFAFGQRCTHPKDGLFLYGPNGKSKKTREINVGVVGTRTGAAHFRTWARRLANVIEVPPPGKTDKANRLHLANFPGLSEAFGIHFEPDDCSVLSIPLADIERATQILNLNEAVDEVAKLYIDRVEKHLRNEEQNIDVWVLVLPDIIYERCRPEANRTGLILNKGKFAKRQKTTSNLPLLASAGIIDQTSERIFEDVPDFHRRIKAEFLSIAPTQLIRETTLAPEAFLNKAGYPVRKTQDAATTAWNLATGLYYKTQAKPPWRLANVRPGVCYIGMVYKSLPHDPQGHACCAAQMFLNEGDGVVFRGANGPWRTGDREFHLKPEAAKNLMRLVIDTYTEQHGSPPRELFIHGQTTFNNEEWAGFVAAAPSETNLVGVRIRSTSGETKLFRDGDYPVLRGTALCLDDKTAYLWTSGYLPQLDTYIGPETPNPLHVTILRSKNELPKLHDVLQDIMGLTKINYNSCNFNDGLPVTVRFANMVGDVLTMGSAKGVERQPFKFYV